MKKLVLVLSLSFSTIALASGEDIENCRWKDGREMDPRDCATFRWVAEKEKASNNAQKNMAAQEHERYELQKLERESALEQERRAVLDNNKRLEQEWLAEKKANEAENKREMDAYDRKERAAQKASAAREQVIKDRCGADYKKPRIGMTVARAQDCVAKFRLTAELNRADGIVSTYQAGSIYLNVMDGHIVSWGKY